MPTREDVYAAIDSERAYQESLREKAKAEGNTAPVHEIDSYLLYMDSYLHEAKEIGSRDWSPQCAERTLTAVRKVAALAVACMEAHGAPKRKALAVEGDLVRHGFNLGG